MELARGRSAIYDCAIVRIKRRFEILHGRRYTASSCALRHPVLVVWSRSTRQCALMPRRKPALGGTLPRVSLSLDTALSCALPKATVCRVTSCRAAEGTRACSVSGLNGGSVVDRECTQLGLASRADVPSFAPSARGNKRLALEATRSAESPAAALAEFRGDKFAHSSTKPREACLARWEEYHNSWFEWGSPCVSYHRRVNRMCGRDV